MWKALAYTALLIAAAVLAIPSLIVGIGGGMKRDAAGGKGMRNEDLSIRVYLPQEDKTVTMNLEAYVKGVVAAEMPAEFEPEALKAQAVASRTFAVRQMRAFGGGGAAGRPDADVTADPRQGQAWLSEAALRKRWGPFWYGAYQAKISAAVDATRGEIVVYHDEPILAYFHSTSGARTASAKEVWGTDEPYLQSVACRWDAQSPRYRDVKAVAIRDLAARLGDDAAVLTAVQNDDSAVVKVISHTVSGRVDKVRVGDKVFTGTELRRLLGLRSANFVPERRAGQIVFKTIGYGHGVGLCQYGANGMAKENKTYKQILLYYYTGVKLKNIFGS